MKSSELRQRFLDFFKSKDHTIAPSDSLVPPKDPTLLFTGAGMNQFKEFFLGTRRDMKRAASAQKCFRTGDVGEVGHTPSHLTFFEMLGNFSFGDYFKKDAVLFAWEFMTKELRIPAEKLWASVYTQDAEAANLWEKTIGLPPERLVRFGAKENFWPSNAPAMGPNGPCGPCSEIYYDYERCSIGKVCPDPDRCAPGCPCGRFVEVWNLVFTQYDRQFDGSLKDLPAKNIDTGMGLERLTAVMQNKMSVFETDLFEPIIEALVHLLREEAPRVLKTDQRSFVYAIADHVRALTFLIGDGVIPSNEGRGYVLRMLLRKAERAGATLGLSGPFLYKLIPVVTKIMEPAYPELIPRRESIAKVILAEEERFHQMLKEKLPLLEEAVTRTRQVEASSEYGSSQPGRFSAAWAAEFYDTHGISYEEIAEVCRKHGVPVPSRQEFDQELDRVQAKSKQVSKFSGEIFSKDALAELVVQVASSTEFSGYDEENLAHFEARVVGLVQENRLIKEARAAAKIEVILDRSPFYGEAGGQVGDVGVLEGPHGRLNVLDTQWVGNVLVHRCELVDGKVDARDSVKATVDLKRRRLVAQSHTGTHLLHAALKKVLGSHVVQAGSLVAPDRIRFDFSHGQTLSSSQLTRVEEVANEWVCANLPVRVAQMPLEEAKRTGAVALFGEKYGAQVRVVSIGEVSRELCGGTHLSSSSPIGVLTIVEQGSVAAGVRRVEARTGLQAFSYLKSGWEKLNEVAEQFKAPPEQAVDAVKRLLKETKILEEELGRLQVKGASEKARAWKGQSVGSVILFAEQVDEPLDHAGLRALSDAIRKTQREAAIFLSDSQGFCVAASGDGAQAKGVAANELLKLATQVAGGSGGGRADLAQGKLQDVGRFPDVQKKLRDHLMKL